MDKDEDVAHVPGGFNIESKFRGLEERGGGD